MGKAVHNNYITISKAIGIILMVVGHSGCPQFLFKFIYLFHMPLFFFCSGIFFREMKTKEESSLYIKKRIIGLYVPFVKWSVLFLLLHNLLMFVGIYNPYYGFESGSSYYTLTDMFQKLFLILFTMHDYEELLGGFWFIRALFITSLLIVLVSMVRKSFKYKYEMTCLFFLLMTIVIRRLAPDPELWRDISMGSFGAFFYMLGFLLKQYDYVWMNKTGAFFCCIVLFLSLIYFKEGVSMGCGFNKVSVFSVSALSGSMLTLYLSKIIENIVPYVRDCLYYIGNHTLVILALHFLSFRLVSCLIVFFCGIDIVHIAEHPVIKDIHDINPFWWILYTVVGIVISLLLNRVWLVFVSFIKEKIICR